jgi:hypothetical protein
MHRQKSDRSLEPATRIRCRLTLNWYQTVQVAWRSPRLPTSVAGALWAADSNATGAGTLMPIIPIGFSTARGSKSSVKAG